MFYNIQYILYSIFIYIYIKLLNLFNIVKYYIIKENFDIKTNYYII